MEDEEFIQKVMETDDNDVVQRCGSSLRLTWM